MKKESCRGWWVYVSSVCFGELLFTLGDGVILGRIQNNEVPFGRTDQDFQTAFWCTWCRDNYNLTTGVGTTTFSCKFPGAIVYFLGGCLTFNSAKRLTG